MFNCWKINRRKISKIRLDERIKCKKDFDRKIQIERESYENILQQKDKIIQKEIQSIEDNYDKLFLSLEVKNDKEREFLIKNYEKKILNQLEQFKKDKKENDFYVKQLEREFSDKEDNLIKKQEEISKHFILLMKAIDETKIEITENQLMTSRHQNDFKILIQSLAKVTNISSEIERKKYNLDNLTKKVLDLTLSFERKNLKLKKLE